ncbi:MAG: 3-methyladenine glycosylase [Verrucomicrobiales bacterium]|nr:3-methyladenine glycosylase [Verrucomicrobiales bacterium]
MIFQPLPRSLYEPSADKVAQSLLGHYLLRNTPKGPAGGRIVETEAYLIGDPACHSYGGPSARNQSMFGPPGHAYVYLIYGIYYCFNTVCRPPGHAEAVLVRAIEPEFEVDWMQQQRKADTLKLLTNGPGRLCLALNINRKLDGVDLCDTKSPLFIAENPKRKKTLKELGPMVTTTRIGITKAAEHPLRFYLSASPFVSKR